MEGNSIIYDLGLHQTVRIDNYLDVQRVPGGWIYKSYTESDSGFLQVSSCFVRFDNEFLKVERDGDQ